MSRILVVDDEPQVLSSIQHILEDAYFEVLTATNGYEALQIIGDSHPSLVILDIIMPEMSGLEICRRLRSDPFTAKIPIIFLTAKGRPIDVANGLDLGADDYLVKPLEVIELPARVRALLRRAVGSVLDPNSDSLLIGDIQISHNQLKIQVQGKTVELTPIEHKLLYYLMRHAGQPVEVEKLLEDVWEYPPGVGDPRLVRVHMVNLRNKIEPSEDESNYIINVRGRGYMLVAQQQN